MPDRNCKNYNFVVLEKFCKLGLGSDTSMSFSLHTLMAEITEKLTNLHVHEWYLEVTRGTGRLVICRSQMKKKDSKQIPRKVMVNEDNSYQECKGHTKCRSLISGHFAKHNYLGVTRVHAHAQCIYLYHMTSLLFRG